MIRITDWWMGCTKVSISFTMSGAPFAFSSRKLRYENEISYRSTQTLAWRERRRR